MFATTGELGVPLAVMVVMSSRLEMVAVTPFISSRTNPFKLTGPRLNALLFSKRTVVSCGRLLERDLEL